MDVRVDVHVGVLVCTYTCVCVYVRVRACGAFEFRFDDVCARVRDVHITTNTYLPHKHSYATALSIVAVGKHLVLVAHVKIARRAHVSAHQQVFALRFRAY